MNYTRRPVFINRIIDAAKYVAILADNLPQGVNDMDLNNFVFQQDNYLKHSKTNK